MIKTFETARNAAGSATALRGYGFSYLVHLPFFSFFFCLFLFLVSSSGPPICTADGPAIPSMYLSGNETALGVG